MTIEYPDRPVFEFANSRARELEMRFQADVVFCNGRILPSFFRRFRDFIEQVRHDSPHRSGAIYIVVRTPGGSAETAERMVGVLRKHYKVVNFIVPDFAMSAGTILCLSGDRLFMDYASSLGPIDPQVPTPDTGDYVPAMGYLDKVKEITEKGNLVAADVVLLKTLDLAKLALFEQARDLSVDLLRKWLVDYKFREWTVHRTTNPGTPVTEDQKRERAQEIARALADHKLWRSHGRSLDVVKLRELRIEVDDYSDDLEFRRMIREYHDPLTSYLDRTGISIFFHHHSLFS